MTSPTTAAAPMSANSDAPSQTTLRSSPPPTPTAQPPTPTRAPASNPPSANPYAAPSGHPPHSNPKVVSLQLMFPTVDPGVIEIVLESVGGSQDRAIEQLLSITDENFRPEEVPGARREAESQVDLDAEFARSLQLEDEHNARFSQQDHYAQTGSTNPGSGGLPYQPRVRRNPPQGAHSQQQGGVFDHDRYQYNADGPPAGAGPGMLQMEEKLQRAAEVGKQTFNNLFSLAKSKYAEFQQTQQTPQQPQRQGSSSGGLWSGETQQYNQQYNQQHPQQGSAAGWWRGGSGSGYGVGGGRGGVQNYGYNQSGDDHGSFSTRSESFSSESTNDREPASDPRPVIRPSSNRWTPSDTYDDPLPAGRSTPTNSRMAGGRSSPGVGSPENRSATKIDASKLGILPKKKVDLLSTSPNSSSLATSTPNPTSTELEHKDPNPGIPGASASVISKIPPTPPGRARAQFGLEDSDDELEYTRNPFDEK